ncbi:hypothetical protein GOBAR_DD11851 [Gossypium barbadense]|nr:hypothetical protein GOBAR_DD11851 [Gossypium barbadense]
MLISRLSRVGFRVAKELSRGGYTYLSRARYTQRPCNQYQWSSVVVDNWPSYPAAYDMLDPVGILDCGVLNYCQKLEPFKVPYFKSIMVFLPQLLMVLLQEGMKRKKLSGACEGSLACSTCHVIVMDMEYYNKLEDPTDEENDMLDLAFGLTETSRLGCQIVASPELDGIRLAIPAATRNFAVDGVCKEKMEEVWSKTESHHRLRALKEEVKNYMRGRIPKISPLALIRRDAYKGLFGGTHIVAEIFMYNKFHYEKC